jgi:hypothetical protein
VAVEVEHSAACQGQGEGDGLGLGYGGLEVLGPLGVLPGHEGVIVDVLNLHHVRLHQLIVPAVQQGGSRRDKPDTATLTPSVTLDTPHSRQSGPWTKSCPRYRFREAREADSHAAGSACSGSTPRNTCTARPHSER